MSDYYTKTSNPQANSAGSSSLIRAEFALIEAGLDKLPPLTGNNGELVIVNTAGTAQTTVAAGLTTELLVGGGTSAAPVWTAATGSGAPVRATSPTLVTPVLGVATATSINKLTLTAPATAATLTIADGKTFTVNRTMTLTGTDATQLSLAGNLTTAGAFASTFTMTGVTGVTFPTTGTLATLAGTETLTAKTINLTSNTLSGTVAQFNTALSDGDFATLAGTETLTNKTLTSATLSSCTADGIAVVGFKEIPQNSQSAAYTLVLTDSGKHILHPSADTTARIFTIPSNSSVAYPIGTAITFINQASAGVLTISITTDTMRLAGAGTTGSRTLAANGVATAIKLTATEWIISGGSSLT